MDGSTLGALEWELIPASGHSAHMHMALDEVLLDRVIGGARGPAIRFWEWTERARTITYSMYLPAAAVAGISFRQSYAALDAWAVRSFVDLGVPASYREINDIISPRGKIAGAAQARRKGFVLHHTTIAHSMDVKLVPELIRIGRDRLSERGVRSAEKDVSPLSWFTDLSCAEVTTHMERSFEAAFAARRSSLSHSEVEQARSLVATKYATPAWIERLP